MELWQSPEYEDAEREYEQMNRELMEEVTLSVPVNSRANDYFSSPSCISASNFCTHICKYTTI